MGKHQDLHPTSGPSAVQTSTAFLSLNLQTDPTMTKFLDTEEPGPRKMETIVSMEELSPKPPEDPKHGCCGCCGRKKKQQNTKRPQLPAAQVRYKCVRKCAAVTCSLLGLLLAIVVYLSIGSVLFRYLERDAQQARLAHGLWLLNEAMDHYNLEGKSVQKRADQSGSMKVEKELASYCLDQQFEAVIGELQRLKGREMNVDARVAEVRRLRERASAVTAPENSTEELELLANAVHMSFAEQVETFALLLSEQNQYRLPGSRSMPSVSRDGVLTQIYKAIAAGWRPAGYPAIKLPIVSTQETPKPQTPMPRSFVRLREQPPPDLPLADLRPSTKTDPWTYSGALFYAVTVITTIGYGQLVPHTQLGKICTIIYGFLGIPLMLLFLANLGSLMADVFRLAYQHICHCSRNKQELAPVQRPLPKNARARALQGLENVRHCSTGQALDDKSRKNTVLAAAAAAPRAGSSSPALRDRPGRNHRSPPATRALHHLVQKPSLPGVTESLFVSLMGTNSFFARAARMRQQSRAVRVPILLTLFLFFLYLFGGAVIFSHWENWSFTDATYFVFVTISTIGFGDLIPGIQDADFSKQTQKFIAAITYLLLGLALVCMCFDLMQQELKRKSKKLAQRIGLIDSQ